MFRRRSRRERISPGGDGVWHLTQRMRYGTTIMDSLDSTILDEVAGFVFVLDELGRVRRANRRARELVHAPAGLTDRRLVDLEPASPSVGEALKRLAELAETGRDGDNCS